MKRRLLCIDAKDRNWHFKTLTPEKIEKDPRYDYLLLSGETLCQYILRQDRDALIIARGPLPYLSGNKTTVGYISPLTKLPHYSFVGGNAAAQLLGLGLDALWLTSTLLTPQLQNTTLSRRNNAIVWSKSWSRLFSPIA